MVGQVLSHCRVLGEISRGGMGIVYRAVDTKLDREVGPKTLTAMITVRTPSLGSAIAGDVAPETERIVDKCLAKDRAERYQRMKDLIVDLRGEMEKARDYYRRFYEY